tara:strand:+ start:319 stop:624 length:306 start_codon:yes stop_codon:yes gene_type:complete
MQDYTKQLLIPSRLAKDIWQGGADTEYSGEYNGYRIYRLGGFVKPDVRIVLWKKEVDHAKDAYEWYHIGTKYSLDEAIDLVVSHRVACCMDLSCIENANEL